MKSLLKNIFLLGAVCITLSVSAQTGDDEYDYYTQQYSYGLMFQSKGWGVTFDYTQKMGKHHRVYDFDFVSLKHPKEVRIINGNYDSPPAYVFGKLNKAYALRAGYGTKNYVGIKSNKTNIQLFGQLIGGPVIGFIKPVYLQIIKERTNSAGQTETIVENERYNPEIHTNQAAIYGESSFGNGLGQMSFKAGVFAKAAFGFEWGTYADEVRTLTFGVTVDAFTGKLPIMSKVENNAIFSTFFISFAYGNKN